MERLPKRKVVFLDRDGVINEKRPGIDYVKGWNEFRFLPDVFEALKILTEKGFEIYVITNQRGIARGFLTVEILQDIHRRMLEKFLEKGVAVKGIYFCPHDENECACRKPKPGLLLKAAEEHDINLSEAVVVGDSASDIGAGEAAGCKTILIPANGSLLKTAKSLANF